MATQAIDTSKLRLFPLERYSITVIDGDTLLLVGGGKNVRVRLAGIDAPETPKMGHAGQIGSANSIRYLQNVINESRGQLQLWIDPEASTHGRLVGVLAAGNRNINLELVEQGLAMAYSPKTGTKGVNMHAFNAAQSRAVETGRGLFRTRYFRAMAQLQQSQGMMANVALTDPANLGGSIHARARLMTLQGMARGDHRASTYGGFIGMNTDRPDFGASRSPGNPNSMRIAEAMRKLGIKGDFIAGLDIETSGLAGTDVVTFGGYADLSDPTNPFIHERAISSRLPSGITTDRDYVREKLMQSSMSSQMSRRQLAALDSAQATGAEEFVESFLGRMHGKKNGWLFIHNAHFESKWLSPFIAEKQWEQLLRSGSVASGRISRRHLNTPFDAELERLRQAAQGLAYQGKHDEALVLHSKWFDRIRGMMRGTVSTPQGVKVVDTMDIARGIFGKAHTAGIFNGSTRGLLSQDALAALLGMAAEEHMPTADVMQNFEITSQIMKIGDKLDAGKTLSSKEMAFFKRAQQVQPEMSLYGLYRDIANKMRGMEPNREPGSINVAVKEFQKMMPVREASDLYVGGKPAVEVPGAPRMEYPQISQENTNLLDYTRRQLDRIGEKDMDAGKVISHVFANQEQINEVSQHQFVSHILKDEFAKTKELLGREEAIAAAFDLEYIQAKLSPEKVGKAPSKAKMASEMIFDRAGAWWETLQPKTRRGLKGAGIAVGAVMALGLFRGLMDKQRDAQPRIPYTMTEYMAMRNMSQTGPSQDDRELASQVSTFRMVPNRYPSKV